MIAIVKYNAGNITSVKNAVERLGYSCLVTDDKTLLQQAEKVIFPGVGEASSAMKYLKEKGLDEVIKNLTQPILGICLGQQLLCQFSEEGDTNCLGIFDAIVKKFEPKLKVPHMGWNQVQQVQRHALWEGIPDNSAFYFVHSYYAVPANSAHTVGATDYGSLFTCAVAKDNIFATQFHPEKSAHLGLRLYQNFTRWQP